MAQTTGATSARASVVEYSTNGSSWTDCSGMSNKVETSGGERQTSGTPTFDGDTMIQTAGKRDLLMVKVSGVYTEGGSDLFEAARTAWQAGTAFYFRWTVKAASTGNFRYTTASGIIKNAILPSPDTTSPDAVPVVVELETPEVTKAAIA